MFEDCCIYWIIPQVHGLLPFAIINNTSGILPDVPASKIICIEASAKEAESGGLVICCGCEVSAHVSVAVQLMVSAQKVAILSVPSRISDGLLFKIIIRNTYRNDPDNDAHYQLKDGARMVRVTQLIKSMFYPFDASDTADRAIKMTTKKEKKHPSEYYMDWAQKRMIGTVSHLAIEHVLITRSLIEINQGINVSDIIHRFAVATVDTNICENIHTEGNDTCDHCIFYKTHRDDLIRYISSSAERVYMHCFEPFIENLLTSDPDALIVASECRMSIPLDTTCTHPVYTRAEGRPNTLCGTADMILFTSAQVKDGQFMPGEIQVLYMIDWKTTQKAPGALEAVYRPFRPKQEPVPLPYIESAVAYSVMAPCTMNQYYIQATTYCVQANKLFGMVSTPLICLFKYSPKEGAHLSAYKTILYQPPSPSMTAAWTEILSSMCPAR
jgi:hypothetical protein